MRQSPVADSGWSISLECDSSGYDALTVGQINHREVVVIDTTGRRDPWIRGIGFWGATPKVSCHLSRLNDAVSVPKSVG